ncbi:MAG: hypothetical protein H7X77_06735 [Anaerolineae bacterium]|nr:hypothetical protein [Anaerolineae bacterium]
MASQQSLEDLLAALTDAILADEDKLEPIIARYDVPRTSVDSFVPLLWRLHQTLVGVQPSARFVDRLRQDLKGTAPSGLVQRMRYLPARVQIAAGVVAAAGFMLLARRRLLDLTTTTGDEAEISTVQ